MSKPTILVTGATGAVQVLTARALDADAFDRRQGFPQLERPLVGADSPTWANEHAFQPGPGESLRRST